MGDWWCRSPECDFAGRPDEAVPAHLERNWERDLDQTLSLEPDHVSLCGLSAESATPLGRAVAEGRETLPADEQYEREYLFAVDRLAEAGYEAYEVSNFRRWTMRRSSTWAKSGSSGFGLD